MVINVVIKHYNIEWHHNLKMNRKNIEWKYLYSGKSERLCSGSQKKKNYTDEYLRIRPHGIDNF